MAFFGVIFFSKSFACVKKWQISGMPMRDRQYKYIDFRIDVSQCLIGREEIYLLFQYSERCTGVLVMIFISTSYIVNLEWWGRL